MKESKNKTKSKTIPKKNVNATVSTKDVLEKVEYTPEERALIDKYYLRSKVKPVKFKATEKTKNLDVVGEPTSVVAKMTEALGTPDQELHMFLLDQLSQTFKGFQSSKGVCENSRLVAICNNAMALLQGIKPQDEIEGMLAVQMIAVHNIAMDAMRLVMISDQFSEAKERNTNRATKLLRTFATQMETLKKYRTGGQQKMIIEHIHVSSGGQAIVGSVTQGGGREDKK